MPWEGRYQMAAAIILIILFVLAVLLLLPVRVKGSYGEGAWAVDVYYACFRVFHKESVPKKPPDTPPKPDDNSDPFYGVITEADSVQLHPAAEDSPPAPQPDHTEKPDAPDTVPNNTEKPDAADTVPDHTEKPDAPDTVPDHTEKPDAADIMPNDTEKPDAADIMPNDTEKPDAPDTVPDHTEETDAAESDAEPPKKKRGIKGFIERLKPHGLSDYLALAKDGLAALSPALKFLTKHLHFRHVRLYLAVASDDPAQTAQVYGKICAAAFPLLGALECWVDMQADELRILADFYGTKTDFRIALELRVSPAAAILLVLILGVKFLWRTVCRFRREDKEAKRYAQETAPETANI